MRGIGDEVGPPLALPPLYGVLVNPGVAVPTPDVFRGLGLAVGAAHPGAAHPEVPTGASRDDLLRALEAGRNDLEPPARQLAGEIGEAIDRLRGSPGCRLARMSGSGATVFGLYGDCHAAARAARAISQAEPGWWVKPTLLR